jgi:RNA polymerase sigma-70 factor (ECF subfamily)
MSPHTQLDKREVARVTHAVLEELPEIFRTVLVMREFDDLSYQEIADTLGISIGTVESRLFRARAKFKDKLLQMHPEFGQE